MCLSERKTTSRGRSAVPWIARRTRKCRRLRRSSAVRGLRIGLTSLRPRLAGLTAHLLPRVPDALALVRLRGPDRADLGGQLTDELLVAARDLDHRRLVRGQLD